MNRTEKVVLTDSGEVNTPVCIPVFKDAWGIEEVLRLTTNLGQGDELELIREKTLKFGAGESFLAEVTVLFERRIT